MRKEILYEMKIFLSLVIVFLFVTIPASAQRTMSGQSSLRLECVRTDTAFGAEAFFSQYTLGGYWEVGITGKDYTKPTSANLNLNYMHVAATGDYMFRLVGTRNRAFNLYGGAGAFLGYEAIDPVGNLPQNISTSLACGYFLYGITAKLAAEIFVSPTVALTLGGSTPLNFSSPLGFFHWDVGLGLKIML